MSFDFIKDLCESRLIPSKTSLTKWKGKDLAELAYLYILGLRVLLSGEDRSWAEKYCKKAGEQKDFSEWRNSGNDLYAILYALDNDIDETKIKSETNVSISVSLLRHWLMYPAKTEEIHKLFARLDAMFGITNSAMKSMRRIVMNWEDADEKEKSDVLDKIIQMIHARAASNSEILSHLKKMNKELDDDLNEAATTGATGAASVATVGGTLGAGFDPDGQWRSIYGNTKPVVIKRQRP